MSIKRITDVCLDCGCDITDRMWNATFCIACTTKHVKEKHQERERNRRHQHIEHMIACHCLDCGSIVLVTQPPAPFFCRRCKEIRTRIKTKQRQLNTESRLGQHRDKNMLTEEEKIRAEIRHLRLRTWRRIGMNISND